MVGSAVGGLLDTVVDGATGVLFREQSPRALVEAVRTLERTPFDAPRIRANAERFSTTVFREQIGHFVARSYREWRRCASPERVAVQV